MKKYTVVEVAMEIALDPKILEGIESRMGLYAAVRAAMSTSVGGIGPLLRERIIAQADLGVNVIGVSLLYDKVWLQKWHFWGQFYLERTDSAAYIRPLLKKLDKTITVKMFDGSEIDVDIWEAEYGRGKVYFLDAPEIGNIVYPSSEDAPVDAKDAGKWASEARMKQSWLLGRGTLELLKKLKISPDITILSETPTLFAYHDLVSDGLDKEDLFKNTKYIFNDHTPLEYAHPVWSEKLAETLKIKSKHYKSLESYKSDSNKIDITQLLINALDGVYGVSKIHGDVMREMHTLKSYAGKIEYITNGVSRDIWQAEGLRDFAKMNDKELLSAKQAEKEKLVDWLWQRYKFNSQWRETKKHTPLVMWMRRVVGYKRLDLMKQIVSRQDLLPRFLNLNITMLLGGRIHQNDAQSDWIVFELLDIIQKYPELEDRIILLDNFNVWEAPKIYRGVDGAVMVSDANREASATGFMKAQMNGATILATYDGAVPESVFFFGKEPIKSQPNGFFVDYWNGSPTPEGLLCALEGFKKIYDDTPLRMKAIRSALTQTKQVDVMRASKEMLSFYDKLSDGVKVSNMR